MGRTRSAPGYQRVKEYILHHIHANEWRGGDQVPCGYRKPRPARDACELPNHGMIHGDVVPH